MLVAGTGAAGGAQLSPPAFCDVRVAHDYAKPFERMPPEHPPPQGELPFGPRNLSMHYANFGTRILRSEERIGYWFAAKDAGHRLLRLNWDVDAALWRVGPGGGELRRVGGFHRLLRQVEGPEEFEELDFTLPGQRPGLYRFDLRFRSLSGAPLHGYSEYFRVVPRRFGARLVIGRGLYRPGETVFVQPRNYGTVNLTVPKRLPVERQAGASWVAVPESSTSITEQVPWLLGIGEAPPCSRFHIPTEAEPGRYRFRVKVRVAGAQHPRVLEAAFRVAGAPRDSR